MRGTIRVFCASFLGLMALAYAAPKQVVATTIATGLPNWPVTILMIFVYSICITLLWRAMMRSA